MALPTEFTATLEERDSGMVSVLEMWGGQKEMGWIIDPVFDISKLNIPGDDFRISTFSLGNEYCILAL